MSNSHNNYPKHCTNFWNNERDNIRKIEKHDIKAPFDNTRENDRKNN